MESTFATVRLRTVKSRGCGSRASILSTVFKLAQSAEQRWQKLRGAEMIAKLITGVQFKNGVEVLKLKSAEFSHVFARPRLAARGPRSSCR